MTTDELMARACPIIRDIGWAHYFAPEAEAAAAKIGIDLFTLYAVGRGGVLGDVEPGVVVSSFGYFNPALVADMWTSGSKIVAPRDAGRAYVQCAADHGRARLGAIDGLDAFCAAADAVVEAADPVGLALYAAAAAEPFADDPPARAMQLVALLREFRGSAHLIAVRAVGLDALTAHAVNRPGDLAMFGWDDAAVPEITDDHRARWAEAERLTDQMAVAAYSTLDPAGRQAFVAGIDAIEAALTDSA